MKFLLIIGMLAMGAFLFAGKSNDIAGTWVLDTKDNICEPVVLRIQMAEGYFAGRLDMPGQQVYDKPVTIVMEKDSIKIVLDKKGSCFIEGRITDSLLTGRSVIEEKSEPVKFYRAKR